MRIFLCVVLCCVATGCTSGLTREQQLVRTHVVDACYTLLEEVSENRNARMNNSLELYRQGDVLSEGEVFIIKECIKRTEESRKWKP